MHVTVLRLVPPPTPPMPSLPLVRPTSPRGTVTTPVGVPVLRLVSPPRRPDYSIASTLTGTGRSRDGVLYALRLDPRIHPEELRESPALAAIVRTLIAEGLLSQHPESDAWHWYLLTQAGRVRAASAPTAVHRLRRAFGA